MGEEIALSRTVGHVPSFSLVAIKVEKQVASLICCKGSLRTHLHGVLYLLSFHFPGGSRKRDVPHPLLELWGFFDLLRYTSSEDTRLCKKKNINIVT